ncbi:MAG: hypothetical protein U0359_02225 [Byssovorax sp.]
MSPRALLSSVFALPAVLAIGCGNPALDVRIDALGGEVPGVEPSEYHRPGQPCLLCHGPYKGAEPELAIGGTIFAIPAKSDDDAFTPVEGVTVTLTDAFRVEKTVKTNCIGNFYIKKDDWDPGFPLQAKIDCGKGTVPRYMSTRISRAGSCADCHTGKQDQGSPGWVYCVDEAKSPFKGPGKDCPGIPQ